MADSMNSQSLNRYSYCVNNPLKYADPSGLDYVVALGSGQVCRSEADIDYWDSWVHANFAIGEDEICIFVFDSDPEYCNISVDSSGTINLNAKTWDVGPRLAELKTMMNLPGLTNIKLIGYSEGAATVASFLSDTNNVSSNLTAAFMLERPTWPFLVIIR